MARDRRRAVRRARSDEDREARFRTILDAALAVFAEKGFAEATLDAVAARAGVAKGTLYLYVASKQGLLEALVTTGIAEPIAALEERVANSPMPFDALLRLLLTWIRTEVLETSRRDIARIVIAEATRSPDIAAFYHREVVGRGMRLLRLAAEQAAARGELRSDALARFPQLAIAPGLLALLWSILFARFEPLDVEGLLETHVDLLMRALKEGGS